MNWMDIVVLLIIGVQTFQSFRVGMVRSVISLAGWFVALIAAKIYYKLVATYMVANFKVFSGLEENLYEAFTKNLNSKAQLQQATQTGALGGPLQLPKVLGGLSKNLVDQSQDMVNQMVYGDLAHRISEMIINGLAFMSIVFVILIALNLVMYLAEVIVHLPLLKEANRLGGLVVGLLRGAVSVLVVMTIITFVLPFMEKTWLIDAVQNSQIAIYFYNNNLLLYLIYYLLR